jgi:uncharacterized Zn finger protein
VRNGSVIDLQIGAGQVDALVSGSEIYTVVVRVAAVDPPRWREICGRCAGGIDSIVELLQGRFSKGVMAQLCAQGTGLFPTPPEIEFACSCPDVASMCKHVAAVLYGVGARLDERPELLFRLRQVDERALIATAGTTAPLSDKAVAPGRLLEDADLASVFGVEFAPAAFPAEAASGAKAPSRERPPSPGKPRPPGEPARRGTAASSSKAAAKAGRPPTPRR